MPSPRPALFTAVAPATSAALPLSAADPLFAGAASSPHWLAVTNPDGGSAAAQDAFASALAVDGDTLLVGAPLDDAPGANDGRRLRVRASGRPVAVPGQSWCPRTEPRRRNSATPWH